MTHATTSSPGPEVHAPAATQEPKALEVLAGTEASSSLNSAASTPGNTVIDIKSDGAPAGAGPEVHPYHYRTALSNEEIAERTMVIHRALVHSDGDRKAAADILGTNKTSVTREIQNRPFLKERWGQGVKRDSFKLAKLKKNLNTNLDKAVDAAELQMTNQREWQTVKRVIFEGILNIDKRLKAPKKMYRAKSGHPFEEKMLREYQIQLLEQYRKHMDSYVDQFSTMAKVQAMREGANPEANGAQSRGKPGFRPKGDTYTKVEIKTDTVNLQANQAT